MKNKGLCVAPLSAEKIRRIALFHRTQVLERLERIGKRSPKIALDMLVEGIIDNIQIDIVSRSELPNDYARALPSQGKIMLREDTYNDLINGNPRARFTLAHELGHLFLNHRAVSGFARSNQNLYHETFRDSEWQADTFASEFLAPSQYYETMSDSKIIETFGISRQAVEVTRRKLEQNKKRTANRPDLQFAF